MSRNCIPTSIIGLSKTVCPCPEFANKPVDISDSTRYISELINIKNSASGDCGEGNIWERLNDARQLAIDQFYVDFTAAFAVKYHSKLYEFYNVTGSQARGGINYNAKKYCGIRIYAKGMKGVYATLKTLKIGVSGSGASNLKILRGFKEGFTLTDTEVVYTQTINLVDGWNDITLTQPFGFDVTISEPYYIVYDLPLSAFPFNNHILNCACGGQDFGFNESAYIEGFTVANETVSDINTANYSASANGIILTLQFECDLMLHFCNLIKQGKSNVNYMHLAVTILLKTSVNVLESLRLSGRIDFITLTAKNTIEGEINRLNEQYGATLAYLVDNFPRENYQCIKCNTNTKYTMSVGSILT